MVRPASCIRVTGMQDSPAFFLEDSMDQTVSLPHGHVMPHAPSTVASLLRADGWKVEVAGGGGAHIDVVWVAHHKSDGAVEIACLQQFGTLESPHTPYGWRLFGWGTGPDGRRQWWSDIWIDLMDPSRLGDVDAAQRGLYATEGRARRQSLGEVTVPPGDLYRAALVAALRPTLG